MRAGGKCCSKATSETPEEKTRIQNGILQIRTRPTTLDNVTSSHVLQQERASGRAQSLQTTRRPPLVDHIHPHFFSRQGRDGARSRSEEQMSSGERVSIRRRRCRHGDASGSAQTPSPC